MLPEKKAYLSDAHGLVASVVLSLDYAFPVSAAVVAGCELQLPMPRLQ